MSEKSFEVGDAGEEAVAHILWERGYLVEYGPAGGPDLIIEGLVTVEVKTANLSGRTDRNAKRWQFSLTKLDGQHKPFEEDLLILRCLTDKPCHFVIPGILVQKGLVKIDITHPLPSIYQGKWSLFWEAWKVVDMVFCYRLGEGWLP